jgi:hypothetical protein
MLYELWGVIKFGAERPSLGSYTPDPPAKRVFAVQGCSVPTSAAIGTGSK